MKEKIFEYLRTNFADLGLSKEILLGYAELLAATVTEEDGIAAAAETVKPLLILQQKENDKIRQKYAADREKAEKEKQSKETDTGVKKEEKEKSNSDSKEKGDDKKKDDEIPEYVKKLMADIKDLKTSLKNKDRAMELGNRRKEISGIVGKLPKVLQKAYDRMDLDIADDDYAALKEQVTQEVNDTITEFAQKRAVFSPPFAGQGEGDKKGITKEEADKIAKQLINN